MSLFGSLAATTATATKTPLANKHFGSGGYFATIASSSHSLFLTEDAVIGLVVAPLK